MFPAKAFRDALAANDESSIKRIVHSIKEGAKDHWAEALILASEEGHVDIIHALLDRVDDVNAVTKYADLALDSAVTHGCVDVVNALLDRGADINISHGGFTVLDYALYLKLTEENSDHEHMNTIIALLNRGADMKKFFVSRIMGRDYRIEVFYLDPPAEYVIPAETEFLIIPHLRAATSSLLNQFITNCPARKTVQIGDGSTSPFLDNASLLPDARTIVKSGLKRFIIKNTHYTKTDYPQYYVTSVILSQIVTDPASVSDADRAFAEPYLDLLASLINEIPIEKRINLKKFLVSFPEFRSDLSAIQLLAHKSKINKSLRLPSLPYSLVMMIGEFILGQKSLLFKDDIKTWWPERETTCTGAGGEATATPESVACASSSSSAISSMRAIGPHTQMKQHKGETTCTGAGGEAIATPESVACASSSSSAISSMGAIGPYTQKELKRKHGDDKLKVMDFE